MWHDYISVQSLEEALQILADRGSRARIIAGGTDLILEIERGIRTGIDTLVDVTRVPGLDRITLDGDDVIHLGPMVTHNHCVASPLIRERGLPLALASWEVGAPQIRNRSTVAGNIITASPANDTITPLMAMGATIKLRSLHGERVVELADFYSGFRQTVMAPDEILVDIVFPALKPNQCGTFIKLGLRRAQAISVVHVAMVVTFTLLSPRNRGERRGGDSTSLQEGRGLEGRVIEWASITLGAVTPVIVHASEAEAYLADQVLGEETIERAAELAQKAAAPIDDVRGSAAFRMEMVRVCTQRGLREILADQKPARILEDPVLLWGQDYSGEAPPLSGRTHLAPVVPIKTRINGKKIEVPTGYDKTLLRWLREDAGLTGTKEGCAEGECGACTVFLDGMAVMSCLVPAPRAHGAEVVTVEGLADDGNLHPVQTAFVEDGAVQCGYCIPGFLMSAAMLLEEKPQPNLDEMKQAITGNLCRCTGYYKILQAMENAARMAFKRITTD